MSKIYTQADQLIGRTPLLELTHIEKLYDLNAKIIAKLELLSSSKVILWARGTVHEELY